MRPVEHGASATARVGHGMVLHAAVKNLPSPNTAVRTPNATAAAASHWTRRRPPLRVHPSKMTSAMESLWHQEALMIDALRDCGSCREDYSTPACKVPPRQVCVAVALVGVRGGWRRGGRGGGRRSGGGGWGGRGGRRRRCGRRRGRGRRRWRWWRGGRWWGGRRRRGRGRRQCLPRSGGWWWCRQRRRRCGHSRRMRVDDHRSTAG